MKYIFCDIDGVMVPYGGDKSDHRDFYRPDKWDKEAMYNLNEIIKETGSEVIISSSFRKIRTKDEIQEKFEKAGFRYKIHELLPYPNLKRGSAINLFLKKFSKDIKFVILDDEDHDILDFYEKDKEFVKIKSDKGIRKRDVKEAIEILNN